MDGSRIPGWSGEPEQEDASWPDPAAQRRIRYFARIVASLLLGLIPAMLMRGSHPVIAWLIFTAIFFWLSKPVAERYL
jgi:hypothetical protein